MYKDHLLFVIAIVLTAIISLSMHVIILQYFHAPVLNIDPTFYQPIGIAIKFCTVIGTMFLYICSKEFWTSLALIKRIILFAVLIMALTESLLRTSIMNIIVGNSWQSQILSAIPIYLEFFSLAFIICLLANNTSTKKFFQFLHYMLLTILATMVFIFVGKIAKELLVPLFAYVPNTQLPIIELPYGMRILIPAYITYKEIFYTEYFTMDSFYGNILL